jgi:cytochrome P450
VNDPAPVDLGNPELLNDPVRGYGRLREQAAVIRALYPGMSAPVWLVTRYAEVKDVLHDPRFVVDPSGIPGVEGPSFADQLVESFGIPPEYRKYMKSLLSVDGDEHKRLRLLVARAFNAPRVSEMRTRVEQITDELLDELPAKAEDGVVDLLKDFAIPLSGNVICELVGVDEKDRSNWQEWFHGMSSGDPALVLNAMRGMVERATELIERRWERPADDLITALVRIHDEDGDRLSETEMIALIVLIVQGGHHTTAHFIANATTALLEHPDQLALLRAQPELAPHAVHELLRCVGPVPGTAVVHATEDMDLGGTSIRRGDAVVCMGASANMDPRVFEEPERLDITRESDRRETHLAFGRGQHYCLGAALARQEGEIALVKLFDRYPKLALAVDAQDLPRQPVLGARMLVRLPIRLEPE